MQTHAVSIFLASIHFIHASIYKSPEKNHKEEWRAGARKNYTCEKTKLWSLARGCTTSTTCAPGGGACLLLPSWMKITPIVYLYFLGHAEALVAVCRYLKQQTNIDSSSCGRNDYGGIPMAKTLCAATSTSFLSHE